MIIKKLRWKNFLSTGNYFIELDLTGTDTTLISGKNGSGKSTFLDALTFSLFGKSFRRNNIPQLINSINMKNCMVEIEFEIGNNSFKVIRGLKPKKFEIYKNDELIPQDSNNKDYQKILEEQILKMTYKSFCQVVILGSSNYIPFMQLTASDRRGVVENLLNIDIFSTMNTLVRGKLQMTNEQITVISNKIEITKNKIDEKEKLIKTLEKKSKESVEKYNSEIEESRSQIEELQETIKRQQENIQNLSANVTDKDYIPETLIRMESEEKQFHSKMKILDKNISFYEDNATCPSCKQAIEGQHKDHICQENENEKEQLKKNIDELEEKIELTQKRLEDINAILDTIGSIEKKISENQNKINANQKYISKIQSNIESLMTEGEEISDSKNELNVLIGEGKEQYESRKELIDDKHYYNISANLLKDTGIKSKIIKHYLPVMNKLINQYLSDMNFFCQFTLDENFSETIKSRHRDEFTYYSFSEGERLRIDLSLLLAWREIARIKNSVNCNILVLDEVFDSSLDAIGTEEFLNILRGMGNKANIFVISHKSDTMTDKFDKHIVFEKKNNFTKIK